MAVKPKLYLEVMIMTYEVIYFVLIAFMIGAMIGAHISTQMRIKKIDKEWEELHKDETV
jgi:uncharacterized membrane protein YqgA involved in biofilm formation